MQDANNDYYNEDIVSAERVNFNREGVTVIDGEIYSVTEDGILRMDCFYDQQIKEKKPAIIWIHGGGFTEEDISRKCRPERRFLHLVKEGYFLASIDYRLAQVRPFPAQMEECKCAVRYLRKNADKFGIDPERIGIWGESCGGQIAGLMSVSEGIPDFEDKGGCEGVSSEIQAAVSWYGALDALEFHNIRMAVDPDYPPRFAVIYGGSPEKMKDVLNKRAIENFIKAGALDTLGGTRKQFMSIYIQIVEHVNQEKKYSMSGQMSLFDLAGEEEKADFQIRMPDVGEYAKENLLAFEKEVLGIYISGHPLEEYMERLRRKKS